MGGGEGGNMSYSGGRVDSGSVPMVQNEGQQADRVAEMEDNGSGVGGGALQARSSNRSMEVGDFVGQLTNAAMMAGWTLGSQHTGQQGGGGGYRGGGGSIIPNAMGGSPNAGRAAGGRAGQIAGFLGQGRVAAQQYLRGGGIGGFASGLGRLGTYGALGYAAYQLVDAGIQTYADSRTLGISTLNSDNGNGWGFDQVVGRSTMSLSPFVTEEEAKAIYGSAIDQGWASRSGGLPQGTFGQAVNFMYGAAKDYNLDPSVSAQLLQTNSLGAGESVQALSEQLLTLKQTLDGTGVSMNVASSNFTNFTGQLIAAGSSGPEAATIAGGALAAYAGNSYLGPSGRGGQIVASTFASQQGQNVLAGLTGTLPGAVQSAGHGVASTAELQKLTSRFANQAASLSGLDDQEKAAMFQQLYNSTFGTQIGQQDAYAMMAENIANPNLLSTGMKSYVDQQRISYNTGDASKSAWDRYTGAIRDDASGAWYNKASYASSWFTSIPALWSSGGSENSVRNYSPEVQNLLDNSINPGGITVMDGSGNVVAKGKDAISKWFNDPSNFQKFSASGSKYTIKDQNASWNASNIGGTGNTGDVAAGANANNTIYITLSSQAKQYFDTNKSSLTLDTGKN